MEMIEKIINDWDPIELFPMSPKDEYVNETKLICEYLHNVASFDNMQLAKRINEIFVKRFGSDVYTGDINQCIDIADKIIKSMGKS